MKERIVTKLKKLTKHQLLFFFVILLASFLRLWQLTNVPPSPSMDEASISYNAYSVLKTGADEFKEFPFISQRGYDDWRRSTYLLLMVPFIAVFDLSVIAIRLPSVTLSILIVVATYYIVQYLFAKKSVISDTVALLTTLLLAISPWHIYISRIGHETNAYLSFFIFGVFFFLRGEKMKSWKTIMLSMIFFTLSMVSYYAGQVFIPLFVFVLVVVYRKTLLGIIKNDKRILLPIGLFFVVLVPLVMILFSPKSMVRFQGTSTFKPENHMELFSKRVALRNKAVQERDILGTIIYNQRLFPVQVLFEGYTVHFNPTWLFTNTGGYTHKVPNVGLLYAWELPFILIGIAAFLLHPAIDKKAKIVVACWFLFSPLPGAIATQAPHVMRTYTFLPTWQLFSAFGLFFILNKLRKIKHVGILALSILILWSLQTLYSNYFIVFPREQSKSFHYAFGQIMPYVLANQDKYDKIVFSNQDNLYQSYMVFLYYSHYDPALYQKQGGTKSAGYNETHAFGKYEFRPIVWEKEKGGKILYIGNPTEMSTENVLYKGFHRDGTLGVVVQTKKAAQ